MTKEPAPNLMVCKERHCGFSEDYDSGKHSDWRNAKCPKCGGDNFRLCCGVPSPKSGNRHKALVSAPGKRCKVHGGATWKHGTNCTGTRGFDSTDPKNSSTDPKKLLVAFGAAANDPLARRMVKHHLGVLRRVVEIQLRSGVVPVEFVRILHASFVALSECYLEVIGQKAELEARLARLSEQIESIDGSKTWSEMTKRERASFVAIHGPEAAWEKMHEDVISKD